MRESGERRQTREERDMSKLAFFSIILGSYFALARGGFLFAPEATRKLHLDLFAASNTRLRIAGMVAVACGVIMIHAAQGHDQIAAWVIKCAGWFIVVAASLIHVIFASISRGILVDIIGNMNERTLRIGGVFWIVLGGVLIYLGLAVF